MHQNFKGWQSTWKQDLSLPLSAPGKEAYGPRIDVFEYSDLNSSFLHYTSDHNLTYLVSLSPPHNVSSDMAIRCLFAKPVSLYGMCNFSYHV
jgi:hypothetical protein